MPCCALNRQPVRTGDSWPKWSLYLSRWHYVCWVFVWPNHS